MPPDTNQQDSVTEQGTVIVDPKAQQDERILSKLREMDDRIKAQDAELVELRKPKEPDIPITDQNKNFWNDPITVLRKELADTVKPLVEFRDEVQANTVYDKVKNSFKTDSRYKEFLAIPEVEGYVDQIMAKNRGVKDETVLGNAYQAAVLSVRGAMELGALDKPKSMINSADPNKPKLELVDPNKDESNKRNDMLPPHLRPSSAPPAGNKSESAKLREMSEDERRLARENKLSDAEYIELTDNVRPADVIKWRSEALKAADKTKEGGK